MPISKILLYACCLLVLVLPYIAYAMDGSLSGYFTALLFLLAAIWGLLKMRKPAEKPTQLSKPLTTDAEKEEAEEELPLSPQSQQLANDIMTTYLGAMYDKARFLPDFDAEIEMESMMSHVTYTLRQHNLTLGEAALEELRANFVEAIARGLKDRKKA